MMAVSLLMAELGDLQRYLARVRVELSLVVARSCVLAPCAALVALGTDPLVRFGIEQSVQGLFDRAAQELGDVPAHLSIVDLDDVVPPSGFFAHGLGSFLVALKWTFAPFSICEKYRSP